MRKAVTTILLTAILCVTLSAYQSPREREHFWGDWALTKSASCVQAGEETRVCKYNESHVETREASPLGHSYGKWTVIKSPSYGQAGEEMRVCKRDASHTEMRVIDALPPIVIYPFEFHMRESMLGWDPIPGAERYTVAFDNDGAQDIGASTCVDIPSGSKVAEVHAYSTGGGVNYSDNIVRFAKLTYDVNGGSPNLAPKLYIAGTWLESSLPAVYKDGIQGVWVSSLDINTMIEIRSFERIPADRTIYAYFGTLPESAHIWGQWQVTKSPTFTQSGEEARVCLINRTHIETRIIPPLPDTVESLAVSGGNVLTATHKTDQSVQLSIKIKYTHG